MNRFNPTGRGSWDLVIKQVLFQYLSVIAHWEVFLVERLDDGVPAFGPAEQIDVTAAFAAEGKELLRGSVCWQVLFAHTTGLPTYHLCRFLSERSRISVR